MQKSRLSLISLTLVTLIFTLVPFPSSAQSGRGRPKVAPREPAAPPPAPVKVPEAAAVVKQEQSGNTSRFVLRNGMTVIISEQHAAPIAAAVAYFKVGAADEPAWANGISALLERAINQRLSIDARKAGAIIDSSTSFEGTSYEIVAAPERFKGALAVQANALQTPSFEADSISRLSIRNLDPSTYAMERLYGVAFTTHPISRASLPVGESVRSITREHLSEFHNIHYRPDNLIIAVVGDVATFDTLVEIERLYGGFKAAQPNQPAAGGAQDKPAQKPVPKKPAPAPQPIATQTTAAQTTTPQTITAVKPAMEPEQAALRYGAERGDVSQSIVTVGFHVPGRSSKDWAATEVLAALLGQGRGSQLGRSLVAGQTSVNRVESSYLALSDLGFLTVQLWLIPDLQGGGAIDKAEAAFFKEIDRLRREVPAEAEMVRAKSVVEKSFIDRNETYAGRARELARAEAATSSITAAFGYRDLIRAVRAEDVQRVAGRYLTLANTSVHEYEPAAAPPRTFDAAAFSKTVLAWSSGLAQPVEPKDARVAETSSQITLATQGKEISRDERATFESVQPLPIRDFSTLNGPRVFVREDHSQPKVAVAILFAGGRGVEEEASSGTTELMLRTLLRGSERRSAAQVAHELDQLGADVRIVVEPDYFGFILDVFSHNAERAVRILRDVTEEPSFKDEDIKLAQAEQIGLIRQSRDDAFLRSKELMLQSLFPAHPYSLPTHGREEVVAKLDAEQLRAWHERMVRNQIPVAIIVGDTYGSSLVSGSLAEGFRRREAEGEIKIKQAQAAKPGEKVESRQRSVTVISMGLAGPKPGAAEWPAIELIKSALNNSAMLDAEARIAGGVIYAQLVAAPEDEARARAAMIQEFDRINRSGLAADDIERARAAAAAMKLASWQSHSERALAYARAVFQQQQAVEVETYADRLSKVTADDVKRAAATYFKPAATAAGILRGAKPALQPAPAKQN